MAICQQPGFRTPAVLRRLHFLSCAMTNEIERRRAMRRRVGRGWLAMGSSIRTDEIKQVCSVCKAQISGDADAKFTSHGLCLKCSDEAIKGMCGV